MAGPFFEISEEVPAKGRSTDLLTWTQNLLPTTLVDKGLAFYQLDWPVPKGPQYPISLRSFYSQMFVIPGQITIPAKMRRMERTSAAGTQRQDIARMERAAPGVMQRIDE